MSSLDDLRASQDRDFGQEGIPMLLALFDETGGLPPVVTEPEPVGDDARQLTALLDRLRTDLAPTRRDDDLGVTTTLLAVAGWVDDTRERP